MGEEIKKPLLGIRTFAQDLEQHKSKASPDLATATKSKPLPETAPVVLTDKLKAASSFDTPAPTNIKPPAFHELHKKSGAQKESTVASPDKKIFSNPVVSEATFDENNKLSKVSKKKSSHLAVEATIITDTKKNKVDVISSSKSSLASWWQEFKKGLKRKQPPKYTVADSERRKGVIQKATSKTGTIFTADNETLKEEIRRRQQTAPPQESSNSNESELLWTPNTEVGYPLLASKNQTEAPANVKVTFKKRTLPPPVIVEPTKKPEVLPEPAAVEPAIISNDFLNVVEPKVANVENTHVTPVEINRVEPSVSSWSTKEETLAPVLNQESAPYFSSIVAADKPIDKVLETAPIYDEPAVKMTPPAPLAKPKISFQLGSFDRINTNRLSLSIVGILAGAVLAIFLAQFIIGVFSPAEPASNTNEPAVALSSGSQIVDLPISSLTETSLEAALTLVPEANSGRSEIRLVDQNTGAVIPTQEILRFFNFDVNPNFNQSITDVRLVLIGQERALIFKVTDATTVFGALLEWEPRMINDLRDILKLSTEVVGAAPNDDTIGQSDVRILADVNNEVLVYGFIQKNLVLITKNSLTFRAIAEDN